MGIFINGNPIEFPLFLFYTYIASHNYRLLLYSQSVIMDHYILSLDQGTTSSRAIIFDKKGNIVTVAQKEFTQIFPKPGKLDYGSSGVETSDMSTTVRYA